MMAEDRRELMIGTKGFQKATPCYGEPARRQDAAREFVRPAHPAGKEGTLPPETDIAKARGVGHVRHGTHAGGAAKAEGEESLELVSSEVRGHKAVPALIVSRRPG
jgi:hypothetical protein